MTLLYRKLVNALKSEYPHLRISVRRGKLPKGYDGLTTEEDGEFLVRLSSELTESALLDCLIHEFAHCPAWTEYTVHNIEHGPQWGIEHSRCYRALERVMDKINGS